MCLHIGALAPRTLLFLQVRAAAVRQGKAVQQVKYSKARKVQAVQRGQGQAVSAVASSTVFSGLQPITKSRAALEAALCRKPS